MNEKLTMTLKWLSYVALFFCAVWFVFLCYQSYHQVFDTTGSHIHWEAKQNQVLFVSTVFLLSYLHCCYFTFPSNSCIRQSQSGIHF